MVMEQKEVNRPFCNMSEEIFHLYGTLTADNKEKVKRLIATLLNQRSNDQRSSDSQM